MANAAEPELTDGLYTVFAVDAADRLTLVSVVDGEPQFKQVMLSFISCPKLGRRQASGELAEDEPCAYDAMDFVRVRVIGKQVRFTDHFWVGPLKRMSGALQLQDGSDIAVALLKAGLATITSRPPAKMDKDLHTEFLAHQTIARNAKVGVHSPHAGERIRCVLPHPPEDPQGFAQALKDTSMKVRVDRVASGTGLLLHVANPDDDLDFQAIQATMTGAQANSTVTRDGAPDAMGQAAKAHTERLLLHRMITVKFEGLDANGNFLVSIISPKGTFQEDLINRGYAKVNHSTVDRTEHADKLRTAEREAKAAGVGIWKNGSGEDNKAAATGPDGEPRVVVVTSGAQPAPGAAGAAAQQQKAAPQYKGDASFEGTVVQIVNGDTIFVRNSKTKEYVKVSLAGVRAPKVSNREGEVRGGQRPPESRVSHENYTWEAREFLRTTCIGQRVRVNVEYARVMEGDSKEVRGMASVIDCETGSNIGAALLRRGLAKFFLGRNDVCSCAEELRAAEQAAAEEKLGVHNEKVTSPSTKVTELNRIGEKQGKHYLAFFQRGMIGKKPPTWRAVVETVMSGSSFRVYVPKEHCQFTLKLAGIVTPSNFGDSNDPFAEESRDYAVTTLQQREVDIMVETVDRGGNFIGYLLFRGKNFGVQLVAEGLATCSGADRTLFPTELAAAEKAAKEAKKNIWSEKGAVPAMAAKRAAVMAAREQSRASYQKPDTLGQAWQHVQVTNVDNSASVHLVFGNDEVDATREAMATLIDQIGGSEEKKHAPSRGEIVVVHFKEDKSWYRGKVVEVYPQDKRADVAFIDFGNVIEAPFKEIRAIPADATYDILRTTAPLAKPARLAWIKNREDGNEWIDDAVAAAWAYIGDASEVLQARLEYTSDGGSQKYYSIAHKQEALSLQEDLLQQGLALVDRGAVVIDPSSVTKHLAKQEIARKQHIGMWIHGDFEEDEDDN
jgi:staphylococcal nuclease domain-containing protein 1